MSLHVPPSSITLHEVFARREIKSAVFIAIDVGLVQSTNTTITVVHQVPGTRIEAIMASGYGIHGGQSRCFVFWQELLACYVVNTAGDDSLGAAKCAPALEDYYECLHHKKERDRITAITQAYRRHELAHPRANQPRAEQIRNLGLLGKEKDTEAVLGEEYMKAHAEKNK